MSNLLYYLVVVFNSYCIIEFFLLFMFSIIILKFQNQKDIYIITLDDLATLITATKYLKHLAILSLNAMLHKINGKLK